LGGGRGEGADGGDDGSNIVIIVVIYRERTVVERGVSMTGDKVKR